ncbi:MAG: aminotransferase class I/II-fold pyridoxal phosphate-dependent enzyme [Promethearchaeota archaeon]|nr:MAG: aminotransferase class I/II-fold pyridoxal phosphate-dependent enzyme [Candidatus Lokiarchaeota archaeon]
MQIRLDKNEMPNPPPREVIEKTKLSIEQINRYTPQNEVNIIIELLSDYVNVPPESLILCSGSDILLKEFIYLFSKDRQIVIADPSFFLISNTSQKTASPILKVRLKEPEFNLPLVSLLGEINKPTLMVIDNPNNPTGNLLLNEEDVKIILENENVILLIDEAYFEFSNITFSHLIKDYPNLAIARTLSKSFGLAGSGLGYLIAGNITQERFSGLDIMLPYPSVISAIHALKNKDYMYRYIEDIKRERERMTKSIKKLGVTVYPSYSNFLLIKSNIHELPQKLQERAIFVSNLSHYSLSSEFIRVTISSRKENDIFIQVFQSILESQ